VVRTLDRHHIQMLDITTHRPTLDDVFLTVTAGGPSARGDGSRADTGTARA
jgi:hypothetical protein